MKYHQKKSQTFLGVLTLFPPPPTSFPNVLQTKKLAPKTFWLLVLTHATLVRIFKGPYLVSAPNYWTLIKTTPQKKCFFWSNPYKIEVMITSLIKLLELPKFGHITISTIYFESRDKNFVGDAMDLIVTSQPLFQNVITKIVTIFI